MNIFEAADGFLPSALIVAYPRIAMTADGPVTTINMISKIISVLMVRSSEDGFRRKRLPGFLSIYLS